jgi:hypothetical protein
MVTLLTGGLLPTLGAISTWLGKSPSPPRSAPGAGDAQQNHSAVQALHDHEAQKHTGNGTSTTCQGRADSAFIKQLFCMGKRRIKAPLNMNYGYQSIHGHQKALVGHSLGNEFKIRDPKSGLLDKGAYIEVDYVKNAESIGLKAWFAKNEDEVRVARRAARSEDGPP